MKGFFKIQFSLNCGLFLVICKWLLMNLIIEWSKIKERWGWIMESEDIQKEFIMQNYKY